MCNATGEALVPVPLVVTFETDADDTGLLVQLVSAHLAGLLAADVTNLLSVGQMKDLEGQCLAAIHGDALLEDRRRYIPSQKTLSQRLMAPVKLT